jgi:hypothetical protein
MPVNSGWEVDDERGSRVVSLLKEYRDEQVIIDMELEDGEDGPLDDLEEAGGEGDADDDGDALPDVRFRVSIIKPTGAALVFECASNGQYVSIRNIMLDEQGSDSDDDDDDEEEEAVAVDSNGEGAVEDPYTGPPFAELDDTLQQAFLDYLEERGVTAELGRYLQLLYEDKAATEYLAWLQRVRNFIAT